MTTPHLTKRQHEVLEALCDPAGLERAEIADRLGLSIAHVDNLCSEVLKAYSCPTVTILVVRVLGARLERCRAELEAVSDRHGDDRRRLVEGE